MGKTHGPRFLPALLVLASFLTITAVAGAQDAASCSRPMREISRVTRPTGVLRADPNANDTASQKIAADVDRACPSLSDASAFRQVRMTISDNHIIVAGTVPTQSDAQSLIDIAVANADGRTVFNRLEVVPQQTASRTR